MLPLFTPAELTCEAIRAARGDAEAADVAERADLTVEELTAIEAGQPVPATTLVAIARALERNPFPLLIAAGAVGDRYVAAAVAGIFEHDAAFPDGWGGWTVEELAQARELVADPGATGEDGRRLAGRVFVVAGTNETRWDDGALPAYERGLLASEVTALIDFWGYFDYRCWAASSDPVTWEGLVKTGAHVCPADLPNAA